MKKVRIIEIDDNNNSNIFEDVEFEAVSVTTQDSDEAFQDALFDQIADDYNIVLDAGGGNDAKKVLMMLEKANEADNFTYLIPVGNSRAQAQNAKDTFDLIDRPEQCVFVLNQVHDLKKVEKEFLFFFGDDKLGVKPAFENEVEYIALGFSPAFELAAAVGKTIGNLAEVADKLQGQNIRELFYAQSDGNKDEFKKLYAQYGQSQMAHEYLEHNFPALVEKLKGVKNVCVVSSKGGVGKSTISWHLITKILQESE